MYEIPLKPVKNLTLGKGLEKGISRMLLYVTARPIRVMWQSLRAAKSTQSQKWKKTESKALVLQVHERLFHGPIYYLYTYTSGSAARHPSLYLALRARPWLRMSQSYDLSDVDTTLMLFASATMASPSEVGWLASKVSRYLSSLCLWSRGGSEVPWLARCIALEVCPLPSLALPFRPSSPPFH